MEDKQTKYGDFPPRLGRRHVGFLRNEDSKRIIRVITSEVTQPYGHDTLTLQTDGRINGQTDNLRSQ